MTKLMGSTKTVPFTCVKFLVCAYLHGTRAKPARVTTRYTSQQSSEVDADSDAAEVVAVGTGVRLASSSSSSLLLLLLSLRGTVGPPYEHRRNV